MVGWFACSVGTCSAKSPRQHPEHECRAKAQRRYAVRARVYKAGCMPSGSNSVLPSICLNAHNCKGSVLWVPAVLVRTSAPGIQRLARKRMPGPTTVTSTTPTALKKHKLLEANQRKQGYARFCFIEKRNMQPRDAGLHGSPTLLARSLN
jgi:hypothetical protein